MPNHVHDTPAEVAAEEGQVLVEGPGGITYSFTPAAAVETSGRLFEGAAQAREQQDLEQDGREKPGDQSH